LAAKAQADLDAFDRKKLATKLRAIVSAAKYPVVQVAGVLGVSAETVWRWATAYRENGMEGLSPKPKKPRGSKLAASQKKEAISWLDEAKTPKGKHAHWTLEKLRQALIDEFGVTLTVNAIWVWLRKEKKVLKVPRPRHYDADPEAQEDFKKTSGDGERESRCRRVFFRRRALRPPAERGQALGEQGRAPDSESEDRV
jgi:transposase